VLVIYVDSRWAVPLLGSDFLCSEEATARAARASHGMFMTGFMEVWLRIIVQRRKKDSEWSVCLTFRCLERRCNSSNLVLATLRLRMRKYCLAFT